FDVEIFRKLIEQLTRAHPIVRAPIRRRFGLGPPVYRIDAAARCEPPPIRVHEAPAPDAGLPRSFSERLNESHSLRRGELLRFDVVRYAGGAAGTDLAASWAHLLFDGAGSERFVRWLHDCFRGACEPATLPRPDELAPAHREGPGMRERGDRARAWQRWLHQMGDPPMRSLAGPLRRARQALRYDVHTFTSGETERVVESARRRAGFLTPMLFYLAAAIRAHRAVFQARGVDPGSFVVPLPVNLRPKGAEGAIFRTHTSLLWFHVLRERAECLDALLSDLKQQRLAAIKAGHVENGRYAMDFARFAPARLYSRRARAALRGELCSFFFAYTGEFLDGLQHFLGCEIRNGFHVAPVPPSPGSCVAMSLYGDRLNVTHVYQEGVLSDRERDVFRAQLRADLLA
ncbi:MAG TPA: hypothetical protein VIY27_12675, partial [Myxococcota bacterium]